MIRFEQILTDSGMTNQNPKVILNPHLIEVRVPKKAKQKKRISRLSFLWESLIGKAEENCVFSLDKYDTDTHSVIVFKVPTSELSNVLDFLEGLDVGEVGLGELNVMRLETTLPPISSNSKADSKLPLQIIYSQIYSGASISFDYILFLIIASIIAGIGLATDNSVTVVASMLVSPLMGPILAFTFGSILLDGKLVKRGVWSEFIGVLVVWLCGVILGLIFSPFGNDLEWPAGQMADRGTPVGLLIGIGIAFPSGVGVALSVAGGVVSSLVGVAISAALLPPVVNSGMNFIYAFVGPLWNVGVERDAYLIISLFSFLLYMVNIIFIFIGGIITFKVKQFAPVEKNVNWKEVVDWSKKDRKKTLINYTK
eukprot:TRINITY_DN11639_c0_g1_i1.p1 TRINITY_DN11639_c0_g1~~TRINITY_DN11639_c0_g1_i1.p1  ORF type:complete len:368 (+),score=74.53 TRINITY_DN11639_c0_g1_i1:14-1117(+)